MPAPKESTTIAEQLVTSYFSDNYFETYANQALYESSAWDLKIIFGTLDQSTATARTKKNFAVNIPWAQIKLAIFQLQVQLAVTELLNGKVLIRQDLLPQEMPPIQDSDADPTAKQIREIYNRIREEFLREC